MPLTSAHDLALEIVQDCLNYGHWPNRALDALIERALDDTEEFAALSATKALFGVVIERLADLFDPQLCDVYAQLFSRVIARVLPELDADELLLRHRQIRRPRPFLGGEIRRIFVLSRITLGADVAVTSVVLSAMKQRFPEAEICLVGPAKNAELFAADPRITPVAVNYGRNSSLRERLLAAMELRSLVDESGSLVVDPDSRLTQLGLIPVCDDSRYYFFESRAFGGESLLGLPELTAMWLQEVFAAGKTTAYIAPVLANPLADCCVSFGVGENDDKRLGDRFEHEVLSALLQKEMAVLLDSGAGGAEANRALDLQRQLDSPLLSIHNGAYASFAAQIAQSKLYVGYDSAGQHVASAAGIPLISVFAGHPSKRMFARWRPGGPQALVIEVEENDRDSALPQTLQAIAKVG